MRSLVDGVYKSFSALEAFLENLEDAVEAVISVQQAKLAYAEQNWDWDAPPPAGLDLEDSPESDREALFRVTMPRTLRYSTVLHAHAAIDGLLSKLCDEVQGGLSEYDFRARIWPIRES